MQFRVGTSGQSIVLADVVVQHLRRHRQLRPWQSEAGGQLFAKLDGAQIEIVEATGPRSTDGRGRTHYHPDKRAEQKEIDERHKRGLHFVGDWHSHPEKFPKPSPTDFASITDVVRRSTHELNGFVLIIVGTADGAAGIHLSVHDGTQGFRLFPDDDARAPEPCSTINWISQRLI